MKYKTAEGNPQVVHLKGQLYILLKETNSHEERRKESIQADTLIQNQYCIATAFAVIVS